MADPAAAGAAGAATTDRLTGRAGLELSPTKTTAELKEAKDAKEPKILLPGPCEGRRGFLPESPVGNVTVGGQFSDRMSGAYIDTITGLWSSGTGKGRSAPPSNPGLSASSTAAQSPESIASVSTPM